MSDETTRDRLPCRPGLTGFTFIKPKNLDRAWLMIGLLLLLLPISRLSSQQLNFKASVDRTTIGLNETFTLEVTASGENIGGVPRPELPALPDFDLLGQSQSQATNISFINGKMTQQNTITYLYTLRPKKTGKAVIGPCRLKYQNQEYQTQSIELEIVSAGNQPAPVPGQTPSPGPAPAGPGSSENLFIAARAHRTSVYKGEQINVDYTIYSAYNIEDLSNVQWPSFSGFWSEKIYEPQRINFQRTHYQGKPFLSALIKKMAVFPVATGSLRLEPMSMSVIVVQPPRDFFDFFGTSQQVQITSNALTINVQPLPDPPPPTFTGGVGKFTMQAVLDRDSSIGGEPINLKVRISGEGNIRLIDKPALPVITGARVLEPEVRDAVRVRGETIEGDKDFVFPIIPQTDGEFIIPGLVMSFFNPRTRTYETVKTAELRFTALKTSVAGTVSDASGMKILGTDIHFIKANARNLNRTGFSYKTWFNLVYPLALVGLFISFRIQRHRQRAATDHSYARRLRSNRLVRQRLAAAEKKLKKEAFPDFYATLWQAIIGYTGDRFNLETQAMTREQFRGALASRGVPTQDLDRLTAILDRCDTARFSPQVSAPDDPAAILQETRQILNRL